MKKNVNEFRDLSELELDKKVVDLKQELFNLRFQLAVNQLDNPMRIKAVKKQIAIIKTIQRERQLASAVSVREA
ncbi:MAG: 50S ribosomal protein L29 [Oscillospiraceae bacterium]|nr:50S ribosomal protein L29 [Oscillospiraceae bacterium]